MRESQRQEDWKDAGKKVSSGNKQTRKLKQEKVITGQKLKQCLQDKCHEWDIKTWSK